jgi:hypothetical protein
MIRYNRDIRQQQHASKTMSNHSRAFSSQYLKAVAVAKERGGKVYHRANFGQVADWIVRVNGVEVFTIPCNS